jgi:hypothetical protein
VAVRQYRQEHHGDHDAQQRRTRASPGTPASKSASIRLLLGLLGMLLLLADLPCRRAVRPVGQRMAPGIVNDESRAGKPTPHGTGKDGPWENRNMASARRPTTEGRSMVSSDSSP